MANTPVGGQLPDPPELVEILKRLSAHRRKVWNRTYGDEFRDNLNKIGGAFREALRADDRDAARDRLCHFVDAANVECSEDSRRRMLVNLERVMEARRGALTSGDTKFDAMPAELGPEAKKAFGLWIRIRNQRYTSEESAEYWRHPLVWACRWLEERLGISREDLETAAYRLNSTPGLRELKPLLAPDGTVGDTGQPDWLWMVPKFRELDQNGTTARLWRTLLDDFPAVLVEAGLVSAAAAPGKPQDVKTASRKRGRPTDTNPKQDKRIYEAWKTGQYKRQADCDCGLGLPPGGTYAACERHRKRLERRNKRRRTK